MKVLDVDLLHDGLTRNLNRMTRLEKEMTAILKSVEELVALEDALKGEGGQAIRDFYQYCHVPFLQYFLVFKLEFYSVLQQAQHALSTLEPMDTGHMVEGFLDTEVEEGLTRSANITSELTVEANAIMRTVSDIVSLPELDDSQVQEGVKNARIKRNDTLEALYTFDYTQTNQLVSIESSIQAMKEWIQNIEGLFKQGLTDVNFPKDKWSGIAANSAMVLSISAMGLEKGIEAQEGLTCEVPVDTSVESDKAWYEVVGDVLKGIIDGVVKAVVDIFKGLFELLKSLFTDPIGFIGGIVTAIMNPIDTFNAMWDAVETAWNRDVINGDAHSRAEFFSYAIVSIVGLKGVDKLGKAGKIGGAASKGEKTIPYNAMQTDKLKDVVKTNVYTNMKRKSQNTMDLLKNNFSKEAIAKTIQSVKNSEIITNARNILDPTNIKAASAKLYEDVVKAPIANTQIWMKEKKAQFLNAPLPNLGLSPVPLGPSMNMTVREGIEAAKGNMMQIVGKRDGSEGKTKEKFENAMVEAVRSLPPYTKKPIKPRNFKSKVINEDGTTTYTLLSKKNEKEYKVTYDKSGFPIFNEKYETTLPEKFYLESDAIQFNYLSKSLYKEMKENPELATKFTIREIELLEAGKIPKSLTWHHHQQPGKMQLVDYYEHQVASHTGGRAIWGGGEGGRRGIIKKEILEMISWD